MKDNKRIRTSIKWAVCASVWLAVGGAQVAQAQAAGVNLVLNPTFERNSNTVLPNGYSDQIFFSTCAVAEDPRSKVAVRYGYDIVDGQTALDIELVNNSASCVANYNLFVPVSGGRIQVTPGASYELSGQVQMLVHDGISGGGVSFNLEKSDGEYAGGSGTSFSSTTGAYLFVKNVYQAGVPIDGAVPSQILPGFNRGELHPGRTVRFRVRLPSVVATSAPTAVRIGGLTNPTLLSTSGKPVKLTVPLAPIAVSGPVNSTLTLLDANGAKVFTFTRPATFLNGTSWVPVVDGWQFTTGPLSQGRYAIRYALSLPFTQTAAGSGATEVISGSAKSYEVGQLIVDNKAGMYVGQHFHTYPGAPGVTKPPIAVSYQFARSLNNDDIAMSKWWKGDGNYDTAGMAVFDKWAEFHAGSSTAPTRKLLMTFFGSPKWLSSNPTLTNAYGVEDALGLTAAPRDLAVYQRMVTYLVNRYKGRIFAVECWNEPDLGFFAGNPDSSLSLPNQLADVCKVIHTATKNVDPAIVTICPQVSEPANMKTWLGARTSQGEPVTNFCEVAGAHAYYLSGSNARGVNYYGPRSLADTVRGMKTALAELGVSKPIAITEAGFFDASPADWSDGKVFSSKTGAERGEVVYQTLATARELGVTLFGLYSYEGGANKVDVPAGLEGNASLNAADNATVNQRITASVTDLGVPGSGLQPPEVHVFQLPSQTTVSLAAGNKVTFAVTVVNPGLLPLKNVAIADAASISKLTLDSATGASCVKSGAQLRCTLGELKPGAAVTVKFNGTLSPPGWFISSYTVDHSVSVQWDLPTKPSVAAVVKTATDTKTLTVNR